ncbi:MAG: hypothetical protein ACQ9MH_27090 [Nitrospinales bacterium]
MKTKIATLLLLILSTIGYTQKLEFEDFKLYENCPNNLLINAAEPENNLTVVGNINPFYLQADFDGNGLVDLALIIKDSKTGKQGILIIHSETKNCYQIGGGINFGNGGDNWTWMDVWKIYAHKTAEKTIFSSDNDIVEKETVRIQNTGIQVASSEGTANLITWDGNKYIWIHTGD